MHRNYHLVVPVIAAIALGVGACGGSDEADNSAGQTAANTSRASRA